MSLREFLEFGRGIKARRQALRGLIIESLERRHLMTADAFSPYLSEAQPTQEPAAVQATQFVIEVAAAHRTFDLDAASGTI